METRDESTLPISLDTLSKGGDDLIGLPYPRQKGKGLLEGEAVLISVLSRAGVLDNHKGEAESGALAGGGFDANVTGDAGEDNCVDAAALELLLEVCAGKGAPVALRDEDVVGLETRGNGDLRGCSGYWLITHVVRLVDWKL
jgi:hypothetical protein